MLNFNNPKTKKTFAAVIALILVCISISFCVSFPPAPVHNIQKQQCYVNEIRGLCILKNYVFVLELGGKV